MRKGCSEREGICTVDQIGPGVAKTRLGSSDYGASPASLLHSSATLCPHWQVCLLGIWREGWHFHSAIKMELRRALGEYSGPEATGHFKQERVLCSVPDGQGYLLGMRRNLEVWRDWGNLLIIITEKGGVNLHEKCSKAVWRAVSRVHCSVALETVCCGLCPLC